MGSEGPLTTGERAVAELQRHALVDMRQNALEFIETVIRDHQSALSGGAVLKPHFRA